MKKFNRGFTLIELLIVIALLGALAVGLLAALDPFEQLKKGTDTGVRNTVSEIQGAIVRFYAIKNYMPWCDDAACANPLDTTEPSATTLTLLPNTIQAIVDTGELKSDFSTLAGTGTLGKIYVTGDNAAATAAVCYRPTAKSFIADPNSKFDNTGAEVACVPADLDTCYWCVK